MELFIRIKDGQPFEHPILGDNFRQAFPDIDTDNLPPEFAKFVRVEPPLLRMYEKNQTVSYQFIDGVWTDIFTCEQMTAEEKEVVKQNEITSIKTLWASGPYAENWSAWVLNEETFQYEPPIPRPEKDQTKINSGIITFWCGADNNWKDGPVRPEGQYTFDFFTWQWVEITP